jgi:Ca2+-binding EF-hand superfamily protein
MELVEQAKEVFRQLDADGSGFLEKEELTPVISKWITNNGRSFREDPEGLLEEVLACLDVDHDGKVSLIKFIEGFDNLMYEKKKAASAVNVLTRADTAPL